MTHSRPSCPDPEHCHEGEGQLDVAEGAAPVIVCVLVMYTTLPLTVCVTTMVFVEDLTDFAVAAGDREPWSAQKTLEATGRLTGLRSCLQSCSR
jgi:hypothetical protein